MSLTDTISELLKTSRSAQQAIRTAILSKGIAISGNISTYADAINQLKNPTASETFTENGTYDVTDDAEVTVSVESGGGITPIITSVTTSGTYYTSSYFDLDYGLKVGYVEDGTVLITMKTTSSAYENISWSFTLPSGASEDDRGIGNASCDPGVQVAAVTGLDSAKTYKLTAVMSTRSSASDTITARITITEV